MGYSLCGSIDTILAEKPGDYETFLQKLEQQGYEVKRGKYTSVKGKGQKRFIRFRTLGTGYGEDEIKAVLEGKAEHLPHQKQPPKEQPFQLLVDIQGKMAAGKSVGYKKWATKFNLKEMSKTLLGSPPRVRGKERGHRLVAHSPGITPAHAGKSAGYCHRTRL